MRTSSNAEGRVGNKGCCGEVTSVKKINIKIIIQKRFSKFYQVHFRLEEKKVSEFLKYRQVFAQNKYCQENILARHVEDTEKRKFEETRKYQNII